MQFPLLTLRSVMVMSALSAVHWATVAPDWTSDPLYFRTGQRWDCWGSADFYSTSGGGDRQARQMCVVIKSLIKHNSSFFILHSLWSSIYLWKLILCQNSPIFWN